MDRATNGYAPTTLPRWLYVVFSLFLLFGIWLRFTHLETKIFWGDEVYTAMRVSGYTQGDLAALYDGKVHTIAQIQRLQHLAPQHSIADTIHSLVIDDPQHPPLFYVAERIWAGYVGDEPARLRLLAAIISLAAFPALFFLCREFFADDRVGWIAMSLLAVSPFHLIYAHEAREYSLWTVTTLLTTTALLYALRRGSLGAWGLYAASIALTLYGDILSIYVLVAQSLWAFGTLWKDRPALLRFCLSSTLGVLAFGLWIVRVWSHWQTFTSYMSWGSFRYPLRSMVQKWIFNTGTVLFDAEYLQLRLAIVAAFGILLLFAGVVTLIMKAPRKATSLLLLLGGVITTAIIVQDFRTGTYFSTIARYLTPLWLSLEIALAFGFVTWLSNRRWYIRDLAEVTLLIMLTLGGISSYVNGGAPAWWNNHINADSRELAGVINAEERPLLVSAYRPDALLVLSHELRPDIHILLVNDHMPKTLPSGFGNYDVLSPTAEQEAELTKTGMFTVAKREYFLDSGSPIEKFHAELRKEQSAAHLRERQTPQEFLVHLTGPGAFDDDLPFRKALPSRLALTFQQTYSTFLIEVAKQV